MNFTQGIFLVGYAIKITKMILIFLKNEFDGSPEEVNLEKKVNFELDHCVSGSIQSGKNAKDMSRY